MKHLAKTLFLLIVLCISLPTGSAANTETKEATITVEAGTEIKVKLNEDIDVKEVAPGKEITAYVIKNIKIGKDVAIQKGTEIKGLINDVSYQEGGVNQSTLKLEFNKIVLPNSAEKDIVVVISEIGYSILPQSSNTLFEDEQISGTDRILRGGMIESQESKAPSEDSTKISIRQDGTIIAKGVLMDLKEGTRITLRLKKPLQIP